MSKECKWFSVCPMKYFYEMGKVEEKWITEFCYSDWQRCIRFQKEENHVNHPDNMLPNGEIDVNLYE